MSDQSPSRFLDKIIIRVPEGMRNRIKRAADANSRSVNAELLVLLERTFPAETKIDEYIQDIAGLVKSFPEGDQLDLWRSIFDKLTEAKQRNED